MIHINIYIGVYSGHKACTKPVSTTEIRKYMGDYFGIYVVRYIKSNWTLIIFSTNMIYDPALSLQSCLDHVGAVLKSSA